jgi:hypothetical protein
MGLIFPLEPSDLVNFLLNLETLEVVKFWLMTLERAVYIVFPSSRNAVLTLEKQYMPM